MSYDFTRNDSSNVTATELLTGIYDQVDAAYYDVLYPELMWRQEIDAKSIKTDIAPGSMNYVYRSRDWSGMGQFIQGSVNNIPKVGQRVKQINVPILDAAVGATITDAEARRYAVGFGTSLPQDLGETMRKATDWHVERTFFFGNAMAGFDAYIDYPTCTKIPSATWDSATASFMVNAVNNAITSIWTSSKMIHFPDTVVFPPALLALMAATPMVIGTDAGMAQSALEYLKRNNIYTIQTQKPLTIRALRYLEAAGVAGADRIIVKESNPERYVMPFPMAYRLSQPKPAPLAVELYAEYIFGSFNVRYPGAMAYIDVAQA